MRQLLEHSRYHVNGFIDHYRCIEANSMFSNNYHYPEAKVGKTKLHGYEVYIMLFKEFIKQHLADMELPFLSGEGQKYPPKVWSALHQSFLVTQLQYYKRADTIKYFIGSVYDGDDLGGLLLENVIDMWMESMISATTQIIGSALGNSKIKALYDDLTIEREVECSDPHSAVEEQIISKGIEIPIHSHKVRSIEVNDDNREQFNEFVSVVLRNFDSDTYGELPEEYSKAGKNDVDTMLGKFEQMFGQDTDMAGFLNRDKDNGFDSSDYV